MLSIILMNVVLPGVILMNVVLLSVIFGKGSDISNFAKYLSAEYNTSELILLSVILTNVIQNSSEQSSG
jgi:hypothetical protein